MAFGGCHREGSLESLQGRRKLAEDCFIELVLTTPSKTPVVSFFRLLTQNNRGQGERKSQAKELHFSLPSLYYFLLLIVKCFCGLAVSVGRAL